MPVGLAAYCLCCLLWVGFDEPLGMVAVKLAGIYAAVDLVSIVMNHIPILDIWIVRTAIAAATYISLLMSQLDLDQGDAIGVAFATFIVKLIIAWSLLAFLIPLLGLA